MITTVLYYAADVLEEVLHCFSADTVAECRQRVEQAAQTSVGVTVGDWTQDNWALRALAQWDSISDPALVEVSSLYFVLYVLLLTDRPTD